MTDDAWWEDEKARALAAVDALAAQHEKRFLYWSALNLLWTLVLAISSALWWMR